MRPRGLALLATLALCLVVAAPLTAQPGPERVFLPLTVSSAAAPSPQGAFRVNAPYLGAANPDDRFGELAIFWFGKVTRDQNYADVRVGYTDDELYVYVAVFDRRLWFDEAPAPARLTAFDALTLYLDTGAGAGAYRFVAQMSDGGGSAYQAAYRASGGSWTPSGVAFTTRPGWRGGRLNDDGDDRGWAMSFRIPFASLGLPGRPADGSAWRLALTLHDRDSAAGPPLAEQRWPPAADLAAPQTWGVLGFGMPSYTPPATGGRRTVTVRHGLNGARVPDAAVGGGSVCGDGLDFWSEWGDSSREAGKPDFNVQNQSDLADWPCFSKYYVTFPLDGLPAGQVVVSATLVLHQFGNAQPSEARPSLIQAHTVGADWDEATLSWNNAPLATENVGAGWVEPLTAFPGWPGVRREIDVTRAAALAYAAGEPLRLALYSADSDYHSGKYFVSSDTEDWNAAGRPTLLVTVGTPTR